MITHVEYSGSNIASMDKKLHVEMLYNFAPIVIYDPVFGLKTNCLFPFHKFDLYVTFPYLPQWILHLHT